MLGPLGSAAPLRLSFVFLVHSTRCAMLRRTFVFLMLVINNLSFAPLLSDDDDDEMSAETLSRQRIVVVFVCLSVCQSVRPSALYTMPCLSLQRIAFQLHFVGRCVKRSFPSLPCHLPLPHRLILVHLLWRTLFYFLFPLKLFYLQRERRATPSLFGNPLSRRSALLRRFFLNAFFVCCRFSS